MSLQGKTALVTGSAGGLGLSIAKALLSRGANVVLCDINAPRLASLAPSLQPPSRTLLLPADISSDSSVQALIDQSVQRFGRLDIVVNNAGVMDNFDPADSCPVEQWDRVMNINLRGPFLVTKYAVRCMLAQEGGGGVFLNICSVAAERGACAGVAYTASKHGLLGLTRNTAAFYGREGVYAVAMVMGAMLGTNIAEGMAAGGSVHGERMQQARAMYPGTDPVDLEEAARYIVSVCEGDTAKMVNGSTLHLNNNWPAA